MIAEIELAFRHLEGRVAAVTGTKGKSTTTAALGAMLREAGFDARVGGNIGAPLVGLVEGSTEATDVRGRGVELPARGHGALPPARGGLAQPLPRPPRPPPLARGLRRGQGAHLRQPGAGGLGGRERRRPRRARAGPRARAPASSSSASPASRSPSGDGAFFEGGLAQFRLDGRRETLFRRDEVVLPGAHLVGDLLVAAAAARLLGAPAEAIARAVRGLPGRRARARARGHDRRGRVLQRLEGHERRGRAPQPRGLRPAGAGRARRALQGRGLRRPRPRAARPTAGACWPSARRASASRRPSRASVPVDACASLREAVERARAAARPGDVVLLAPACSSFDMFADYADRGRAFKAEVRRLAERLQGGPWLRSSARTSSSSP